MTCRNCANYEKCLSRICYHMGIDDVSGKYIPDIETKCKSFKNASDLVVVLRCKDCKHWGGVVFGNVCSRWSAPLAGMKNCTKPDDFCSYGERRSD